jgi:hypothetical protein
MFIQSACLAEQAVDFLNEIISTKEIWQLNINEITELLSLIKQDIERKVTDYPCELAGKLGCKSSRKECLSGNCPYRFMAQDFLNHFLDKIDEIGRKIIDQYLQQMIFSSAETEQELTKKWKKIKESWRKKIEQKDIRDRLEEALRAFINKDYQAYPSWRIKMRRRKKDGRIISNVSLSKDFIKGWPASVQDKLMKLRLKMRTIEELLDLINECKQAMDLEIRLKQFAEHKRKSTEKK